MDFFARQESARRHTKLLELYFALAVIGTVLFTYLAIAFLLVGRTGTLWNPGLFGLVCLVTLAIIVGGSLFKIAQLSGGGSAVAQMLGGRVVDANTSRPRSVNCST